MTFPIISSWVYKIPGNETGRICILGARSPGHLNCQVILKGLQLLLQRNEQHWKPHWISGAYICIDHCMYIYIYYISFCIFFLPQNHQSFQRLWWQWLNLTRQHLARNVLPWNLTQIKSPKETKNKIYKTVHLSKHVYLETLKFPESGSSLKIQQPEIGVSSPHRLHLHGLHRTLPTPDLKWVRMVNYIWIFQHFKPGVFTLFHDLPWHHQELNHQTPE